MTQKYNVGDVVRITHSDEGYSDALGDQTGWLGTVVTVSEGNGVYVRFNRSGVDPNEDYYYFESEVRLWRAAEPAVPVSKFKVGDTVRFSKEGSVFDGQEGTVTRVPDSTNRLLDYKVTKPANAELYYCNEVGDTCHMDEKDLVLVPKLTAAEKVLVDNGYVIGEKVNVVEGQNAGRTATILRGSADGSFIRADITDGTDDFLFYPEEVEKIVPIAVGEWVRVEGYNPGGTVFEGWEGEVTKVDDRGRYKYTTVKFTGYKYDDGTFPSENIVRAEKPKLKVGDWVQVTGYDSNPDSGWEGRKGKVTAIAGGTVIVDFAPSNDDGGYHGGGFAERHIVPTEAPTPAPEPHWTESTPVGKVAQMTYNSGDFNRVIVRTDSESWLHLYQNHDTGAVRSATRYSNEDTNSLLGHKNPVFV